MPTIADPRADNAAYGGRFIAACLALLLLSGGAGTAYPLIGAFALLVAIFLAVFAVARLGARLDPLEWLIVALALAVPMAQLIPLPYAVWATLPGHALPANILSAAGLGGQAMPASLDPGATIEALLSLIPAIALLIAGRRLDPAGRQLALKALLLIAAASAMLGAVQIILGTSSYNPSYASGHAGQGIGLFTNRNHQAVLLLIALCLLPATRWSREGRSDPLIVAGLAILFTAGILATTSRAALILLPLTFIAAGWRYRRSGKAVVALLLVALAAIALIAWWQGALPRILDRFDAASELRFTFWRTSIELVGGLMPWGGGMGSFPAVYPLFEQRGDLTPLYVNHAHQDYLELLSDAGLAGVAGLLLFAWWFVRRIAGAGKDSIRTGACWGIAILLLFSMVDYPLRMHGLMALFGLLCALAGPPRAMQGARPSWMALATASVAGLVLMAAAIGTGWAEHQRLAGRAEAAASFNPWSTSVQADIAARALAEKRFGDARTAAERALRLMPVDQRALTILALARGETDAVAGQKLLLAAAPLGWRDPPTQTLLIPAYAGAGRFDDAAIRADAQLRQGHAELIPALRTAVSDARFAAAMAKMLRADPPWRRDYMTRLGRLDLLQLRAHRGLLNLLPQRTAAEDGAFISRAIALGDVGEAAALWRSHIGSSHVADPAFVEAARGGPRDNALFGWRRSELDGLTLLPASGGANFEIDGTAAGRMLHQELLLAPGSYRFSFTWRGERPDPSDLFAWTMSCPARGNRIDGVPQIEKGRMSFAFTVAVTACPVQRLAFHIGGTGLSQVTLSGGRVFIASTPVSAAASTPN